MRLCRGSHHGSLPNLARTFESKGARGTADPAWNTESRLFQRRGDRYAVRVAYEIQVVLPRQLPHIPPSDSWI
jgi:hypothetical protein